MPRSCPRCKRAWTKGRVPVQVEVEVSREWLLKPPVGSVVEELEGVYKGCPVCSALDEDTEGPYVWMGQAYCLRHFIDMVMAFDKSYPYRKPDPVGGLATARATYLQHLQGSQDLYEDTLPVPEFRPEP